MERSEIESLLYQALVELEYVQQAAGCTSGLCASSEGRRIVAEGMALLGVKDLSAEELAGALKEGKFEKLEAAPPAK